MYWGLFVVIYIFLHMFQKKMSMLLQDMVHICVYMDDLVIIKNDMFEIHTDNLYNVLNLFEKQGMQVNAVKLICPCNSVSEIEIAVTQEGIKLQPSMLSFIMGIEPPKRNFR